MLVKRAIREGRERNAHVIKQLVIVRKKRPTPFKNPEK
jgi:hypothetical protein